MPSIVTATIDRRVQVLDGSKDDQDAIQRVSDLRARPFVVLLGEPGSGKSTVLACEAMREGVPVLKVRELMTGTPADSDATLFLDALDEYRIDGQRSDKVHNLAQSIRAVAAKRWRLSCRSEDWRKGADVEPIRKTTGGESIVVAQLLPLEHDEAAVILVALGETDPEGFLAKAQSLGALGFTESPLSLKLLHKAVADGGTWPTTRYDLFASATRRLSFEFNEEHKWKERRPAEDILAAAGNTYLLLLASGSHAIWRSNSQPPDGGDARAYVIAHDLKLDSNLLEDMLDTALFRGEGEVFEPMHRTIAEFLAGEALAKAIIGDAERAALPPSRAEALITDADGLPPTEVRGLYAWFAAHLTKLGRGASAVRLIEADAVTVLAYGDAGVFDTPERRAILNGLDRNDPFFRASEVGITAVGGLSGEDLADDFRAVLTGPSDGTHRLHTVLDALTYGTPVKSLRPTLRTMVLDATRPEWQRRRAVEAYLNGADDRVGTIRELFDSLTAEPVSTAREAIRAHLAAQLPDGVLKASDVKSVLADYLQSPDDNMVGRLFSLQRRLENKPLAELFDDSTARWLPRIPDQRRRLEVERVLDYAMAGAIKSTPNLPAPRLWRWSVNVRDYVTTRLKDQTAKAVTAWLDEDNGRETAIFDAILAEDDQTKGPWTVTHKYITTTRRYPSAAVIRHLLAKAEVNQPAASRNRLLAITVDIACRPQADIEAYWETYQRIVREPDCETLLVQLAVTNIEDWRIEDRGRAIKERQQEAEQKVANVQTIAPWLTSMKTGGHTCYLAWAARVYFGDANSNAKGAQGGDNLRRVVDVTDQTTTDAILVGWNYLATTGLGNINAAKLGEAEAKGKSYNVEIAAMAGVDRLIKVGSTPVSTAVPIDVPIAILKSSFVVSDTDWRSQLEKWAIERLNLVPADGSAQLLDYWGAALDAGATQLNGVWRFSEEDACGGAVAQALTSLLGTRRTMAPKALQSALRVGAKHLDYRDLCALSNAALADPTVTGEQRAIWSLAAFVLDPPRHADRFFVEHQSGDARALFDEDLIGVLIEAFGPIVGVSRLHLDAMIVRLIGPTTSPQSDLPRDVVNRAINALASNPDTEAEQALLILVNDSTLATWRPLVRHALAQQARIRRDQRFTHPTAPTIRAAILGGPPVNARDLRAVVMEELRQLQAELHTADNTPWKRYWNVDSKGKVTKPLIENECRDYLLDRLRDRLKKYGIAAAVPEARRGEDTRADMVVLTGAGRNLPIEAKRHFHPDIWVAASTQLQGYTNDPGADGFGIYLVFWFGNVANPTPSRQDGGAGPTSAAELQTMLVNDLSPDLRERTDVIVFDVSNPAATGLKKPRQKRGSRAQPKKTV